MQPRAENARNPREKSLGHSSFVEGWHGRMFSHAVPGLPRTFNGLGRNRSRRVMRAFRPVFDREATCAAVARYSLLRPARSMTHNTRSVTGIVLAGTYPWKKSAFTSLFPRPLLPGAL